MASRRPAFDVSAVRVFFVSRGGMAIAFALFSTVAQLRRVTELGFDPLSLILVGTALEISTFLFEIPTGVVADVYSRRRSVIIGYAIVGLGFLAESVSNSLVTVVLAQGIWGGGWTFISGARSAWLADEIGESEAANLQIRAAQVTRVAGIAGIAAAAAIGTLSLSLSMQVGGVGLIGLAIFLFLCMPENGFQARPEAERETFRAMTTTFRAGVAQIRRRRVLITLMLVTVLAGAASESLDRLQELFLIEEIGFPLDLDWPLVWWFAGIQAVFLMAGLVGLSIVGRWVDARDLRILPRVLTGLAAALVVAVLVFAQAGSLTLALTALVCTSVVRQIEAPLYAAWINRRLESGSRATVLSMMQQADALGQSGGGPMLGWVGRALGVRAALSGAALLLIPVVAMLANAIRRPESSSPS
jgi:DHA3 family tetracycline resistance protein-like MFS transporter